MFGLKKDWSMDVPDRYYTLEDYEGATARWCPGCGDHAILTAVQKICRDEQLPPEKTVAVSGIGCSSRFPHYMKTYGFHGLHGRAFPVACGIKSRRPDLHVWVATGDGDCCSIGAGHWVHAVRYNMDMVAMLFDNNVYGLTKKQTSPTSPQGLSTNTHPLGAPLPPLDPLVATLGITNASFVAQTIDANPVHLHNTLKAAFHHKGFSFVRILQRCPVYTDDAFQCLREDPNTTLLLDHPLGIETGPATKARFPHKLAHDPTDLAAARQVASAGDKVPIGLLYRNPDAPRYDQLCTGGMGMPTSERMAGLEAALARFEI
jgi:2-oxoglutarate/2-oxoacid ferredoxin oxidoreductase subunit beta